MLLPIQQHIIKCISLFCNTFLPSGKEVLVFFMMVGVVVAVLVGWGGRWEVGLGGFWLGETLTPTTLFSMHLTMLGVVIF